MHFDSKQQANNMGKRLYLCSSNFLSFWHCPKKETNPDYGFCELFHKNFTKPISGLVRLNLSSLIRLNFRLARNALKSPIKPSLQPPARKTDGLTRLLTRKILSSKKHSF